MNNSGPEEIAFSSETEKPVENAFRDTALRYIGYLGILGRVCRSFIPYHMANMASVTYVCADAFVRSTASAARGEPEKEILKTAGDVFLWHFLATFALPGIFVQGVSSITSQFRSPRSKCRPRSQFPLLPCFLSSLALPLISGTIDRSVDDFMNQFIRNSKNLGQETLTNEYTNAEQNGEPELDECVCGSHISGKYLKSKWFYDQSKDLNISEIERYYNKLKESPQSNQAALPPPQTREEPSPLRNDISISNADKNNDNRDDRTEEIDEGVQVDRTTRPPKT